MHYNKIEALAFELKRIKDERERFETDMAVLEDIVKTEANNIYGIGDYEGSDMQKTLQCAVNTIIEYYHYLRILKENELKVEVEN